jgi:uncharacterized membrane protein
VTTDRRNLPLWLQRWWIWFAAIFALTFYGFWPSFFSALRESDVGHTIHGFTASGWMMVVVVQSAIMRSRWRRWHRKIGCASLPLAAATVLSGIYMIKIMVARDDVPLLDFEFFYIDLTALILFVILLWRAIIAAQRRDIGLHLRLMACTAIIPLEAALERVFAITFPVWVPNYTVTLTWSLVTLELLMLALILGEIWYRRLRWPFPVMLAYYLVSHLTIVPVASAAWFQGAAKWFGSL